MYRVEDMPSGAPSYNRLTWGLAGLALLAIVLVLRYVVGPSAYAVPQDGAAGGGVGAAAAANALPATAAELNAEQAAANAAAARATVPPAPATPGAAAAPAGAPATARPDASSGASAGAGAAAGQRPAYVSALEWQVLQGLAAHSPDPARELARLVAKLRFSKQLELWRGGEAALAAGLLADLPARVGAGDVDRDTARALQRELLAQLEPDPERRRARAEAEAGRLRAAVQEVR